MSAKHWLGPWRMEESYLASFERADVIGILDASGRPVCGVGPQDDKDQGWTAEEIANVRLIAAAPELLDALRDIIAIDANHDSMDDTLQRYKTARAAIAKAEGRVRPGDEL